MRGLNVVMMMLLRGQGVHNGRQYIKVRVFLQPFNYGVNLASKLVDSI
jgi:hypothetical protein